MGLATMPNPLLPLIDISALNSTTEEKSSVLNQIKKACEEWGFFYVVNHSIPTAKIERVLSLGKEFFHLEKEVKLKLTREEDNCSGFADNEVTTYRTDWKEIFDFTPEKLDEVTPGSGNKWPDIPGFRRALVEYQQDMQKLTSVIFPAIIESLVGPGVIMSNNVKKCHPNPEDVGICRFNYYPKCPNSSEHLGIGHHTDPYVITIGLQDGGLTSLQVQSKSGEFYDIPPIKDSFVVNIGDIMQVWSNGKYKAPLHRVLSHPEMERLSLQYFLMPPPNSIIGPLDGTYENDEGKTYIAFPWEEWKRRKERRRYSKNRGNEVKVWHYEISADKIKH